MSEPLASQLRPRNLAEYIGQHHIVGEGRPLATMLSNGQLQSCLLWGPPGVGKTTLARLFANEIDADFIQLSAVFSGVKDIRAAIESARNNHKTTLLFVDEVHRFNKSQQDAFLPVVEDGTIVFIGATTENPSFEVNNALLSRVKVYALTVLSPSELAELLKRAITFLGKSDNDFILNLNEGAEEALIDYAQGDGRRLLNACELLVASFPGQEITQSNLSSVLEKQPGYFDKGGDFFYDCISALHKSVRGSDADASLYWLCRMLTAGVDPAYVARRLVRIASEDIGNADPKALELCLNAWQVQERLGSPEGELALAQACIYLAVAPKSNAVYKAFNSAMKKATQTNNEPVPLHLRNAPTALMQEQGYGIKYRYAHDFEHAYAPNEQYLPSGMRNTVFYQPTGRGLEGKIQKKLEFLLELDKAENKRPKR